MAKNNVYNFIRVKGDEEEVKRMMAAVTVMTDEGIPCFDFNKVIPMPEELRVTHDGISAIRGHINNYLTILAHLSTTQALKSSAIRILRNCTKRYSNTTTRNAPIL